MNHPNSNFNLLNRKNLTPLGMCDSSLLKELGIINKAVVSVIDR